MLAFVVGAIEQDVCSAELFLDLIPSYCFSLWIGAMTLCLAAH